MPHMCQVTPPNGCVLTGRQCCTEVCVLGEVTDRASSSSVPRPRPSTVQVPKSIGGGSLNTLGRSSVSLGSWWLILGELGGWTFRPQTPPPGILGWYKGVHPRVFWEGVRQSRGAEHIPSIIGGGGDPLGACRMSQQGQCLVVNSDLSRVWSLTGGLETLSHNVLCQRDSPAAGTLGIKPGRLNCGWLCCWALEEYG